MPRLRVICVFAVFVMLSVLASAAGTQPTTAHSGLPAAAQPRISAALGRDLPGYAAEARSGRLEFENQRGTLRTRLTEEGVEFLTGGASWRMALVSFGYGDSLSAAQPVAPVADANRVEYRHGPLTEWYVHGPAAVEQGFTLKEAPRGGGRTPLTITLSVGGDLAATEENSARGLLLKTADGHERLRYQGLTAYDADGRELQAHLELSGHRLLLKIEDQHARYPVVIDPLVQLAELTASDGASGDTFGVVAISGNTVVIGAPAHTGQGAAYVFVKPASGWATTSNFTARLSASDGVTGDSFGSSVAISGNTVVVGAFGANSFQGAAYVFVKPASGWATTSNFTAKLTTSEGKANDDFGERVAISGNTVVIGAHEVEVGSNLTQGAAYVFVKPVSGWATTSTYTAKLTSSDGAQGDHFGFGVCVSGSTIAVTADAAMIGSNAHQGAAYIFLKPASGWATTSTFAAKLTASDGLTFDYFGYSASFSSNVLVVGNFAGITGSGGVYVYVKPTGGWVTTSAFNAKLTNGQSADFFGAYVATTGTTIMVGAPSSNSSQGAAYVFLKPASGWATTSKFNAKLAASDGAAGDSFGWVAISGTTEVVGAPQHNNSQGSAYIFGP